VAAIMADQDTAQVVYVGDRNQAINGWNGAIDAMEHAPGERLQLTMSFRFGPAVAEVANEWLDRLDANMRIRGNPAVTSVVGPIDRPTAILCRTNGGVLARVVSLVAAGRRVGLVGTVAEDLRKLAKAAQSLHAGRGCDHPDLLAFRTWAEVKTYVDEDQTAQDLRTLVTLVDKHTPQGILSTVDNLHPEESAEVVVSTAHKSKGREWSAVEVAGDFFEAPEGETLDPEYGMLAYVTVTRAKEHLDPGALGSGETSPAPVLTGIAARAVALVEERFSAELDEIAATAVLAAVAELTGGEEAVQAAAAEPEPPPGPPASWTPAQCPRAAGL